MQISKKSLLGIVVLAIAVGSIGSVAAQSGSEGENADGDKARGPRPMMHVAHHAIRSTTVLPPAEDGGPIRTIRSDSGILESVDGDELVIKQEDGETARVSVGDDTNIHRDRAEAELGDLKTGDHVTTFREKEGDGAYVTRHVGAISAEQWAEMEERRAACEADPNAENCRPKMGRGPGGPGGPGGFGFRREMDGETTDAPVEDVVFFEEAFAA